MTAFRPRVRADRDLPLAYHVYEVGHRFECDGDAVVRSNEVWRRSIDRVSGRTVADDRLMDNRSRVAYAVDPDLLAAGPAQAPGHSASAGGRPAGPPR